MFNYIDKAYYGARVILGAMLMVERLGAEEKLETYYKNSLPCILGHVEIDNPTGKRQKG